MLNARGCLVYYRFFLDSDTDIQPLARLTAVDSNAEIAESRTGGDDLVNPSRVRQYFPETWLWFEHTLGYVIML